MTDVQGSHIPHVWCDRDPSRSTFLKMWGEQNRMPGLVRPEGVASNLSDTRGKATSEVNLQAYGNFVSNKNTVKDIRLGHMRSWSRARRASPNTDANRPSIVAHRLLSLQPHRETSEKGGLRGRILTYGEAVRSPRKGALGARTEHAPHQESESKAKDASNDALMAMEETKVCDPSSGAKRKRGRTTRDMVRDTQQVRQVWARSVCGRSRVSHMAPFHPRPPCGPRVSHARERRDVPTAHRDTGPRAR